MDNNSEETTATSIRSVHNIAKVLMSRICWGRETILGVYCNKTWEDVFSAIVFCLLDRLLRIRTRHASVHIAVSYE